MRRPRPALLAFAGLFLATAAFGQAPADRLLALVPENAGMTAVVENLRERRAPFLRSATANEIRKLPDVLAWWTAHGKGPWTSVEASVKAATGVPLSKAVDDLFGEAVVLSIHTPEDGGPESAKGLFLLAPRDPALLQRLVERINAHEKAAGPLLEIATKKTEQGTYSVRHFQPGTKADEAYVILDDSIFAWSNSEELIRDVIGRHETGGGLSANPRFKAVRASLPDDALLSLFVDPRLVERLAARSPRQGKRTESENRLTSLLARYLSATQYAGASLVWRDGPAIETFESIDPGKLDLPLRRWTGRPQGRENLLASVPPSALWVVAARIDFVALLDLALDVVPEAERDRANRMLDVARGLLLGRDLHDEILPALGPGGVAFADLSQDAKPDDHAAVVIGAELDESKNVRPALENAFHTLATLVSLDDKKAPEETRIRVDQRRGQSVVTLGTPPKSVAYAVSADRVAVGNDADRVAEFVAGGGPDSAGTGLLGGVPERITGSGGFAVVHLGRVIRRVAMHRERIAGEMKISVDDLDSLLAAGRLFHLGYFTTTVGKDSTSVRRSIGMIGNPARP